MARKCHGVLCFSKLEKWRPEERQEESGHSFEDSQLQILAREDCWFEKGVKEAICVKLENPSLNRGGGLRHFLPPTYNAFLHSFH